MNGKDNPKDTSERKEFIRTVWRLTALLASQKRAEVRGESEEEGSAAVPSRHSQDWWEYVIRQTLLASQSSAREFCEYPTQGMGETERRIFMQGYLWAIHVLWQAFMLDRERTT